MNTINTMSTTSMLKNQSQRTYRSESLLPILLSIIASLFLMSTGTYVPKADAATGQRGVQISHFIGVQWIVIHPIVVYGTHIIVIHGVPVVTSTDDHRILPRGEFGGLPAGAGRETHPVQVDRRGALLGIPRASHQMPGIQDRSGGIGPCG